ncbi:hypothetical protein CDD82_1270 [Ophiocordyceps australis]|uniref:Uncharacterized protein n=1 Tax=Ophiocordyceps australis TaxID=1399860 RepID=A0A2C5XNX9_9HYPO|nr:hypothetical protein CDD82_1270 [Ophiocordyceps australis]
MAGSAHDAAMAQRSRFLEGSMKDRASAMPPLAFLGPAQQAALEQPVPLPTTPPRPRRPMMRLGEVWQGVRGRLRLRKPDAPDGAPPPVAPSVPGPLPLPPTLYPSLNGP